MPQKNNKPVKQFRAGGNIVASVWRNEVSQNGRTRERHSVQIQKRFRKEGGEYQDTNVFFQNDLPKLLLVIQKAYEYISFKTS